MLLYGMTGYSETDVSLSIIEIKDKAHALTCHKSVGGGGCRDPFFHLGVSCWWVATPCLVAH